MAFFLGLVSFGVLFYGIGWITQSTYLFNLHNDALLAATTMFVLIGLSHLRKPEGLMYMIPSFLPNPRLLVLLSGVGEIVLAIGLLFPATRFLAAWGLIALLITIFPANINVAVNKLPPPGGLPAKPWYVWSRLLFQPVYIFWIWYAALATM
ncbi:hypothetical protein GCM10027592_25080 [Spirosoma flavus]